MALKHGSKSETGRKKIARASPDDPVQRGTAPATRSAPLASTNRSTSKAGELETKGHAQRREGTRNPASPRKPMPVKARRHPGNT